MTGAYFNRFMLVYLNSFRSHLLCLFSPNHHSLNRLERVLITRTCYILPDVVSCYQMWSPAITTLGHLICNSIEGARQQERIARTKEVSERPPASNSVIDRLNVAIFEVVMSFLVTRCLLRSQNRMLVKYPGLLDLRRPLQYFIDTGRLERVRSCSTGASFSLCSD